MYKDQLKGLIKDIFVIFFLLFGSASGFPMYIRIQMSQICADPEPIRINALPANLFKAQFSVTFVCRIPG
jgi:hypothetical protein